ncbi:MAG: HAD-IIIA family hydrolase, partial [bacterium]|nr:HAD-IIIA family hydrolase [bacterium]MDY4099813.1 HAD-IIIA family hydrolase [Lachnospiraceae bacterium]
LTRLDALYYCPHHPDGKGIYNCVCACRKPSTGLIRRAVKEWNIDLTRSYMVGDRASDIICGKNAGIRTILLESGYGTQRLEQRVAADERYNNLLEFAKCLKK